jgi:hypothetical protein
MFKNMIVVIVLMLTMLVSVNANVSIVEYDKLNAIDTCVDMLDVCYTVYIIEYVVDNVIYTPVVYHTHSVDCNNVITTNNTTMIVNTIDVCATVSNDDNNNTIHATDVVDSIVYATTSATDVVVDDSAMHVDSIVHTHTSVDVYTSAVTMGAAHVVVPAATGDMYSIDYAYYTTYVPMCACVYASMHDVCVYVHAASIGCYSHATNGVYNNTIGIDKGAILLLPYRSVYIIKCICTTHLVLDRHRLKTAIFRAATRRPIVYKCRYEIFIQPKRMELFMR